MPSKSDKNQARDNAASKLKRALGAAVVFLAVVEITSRCLSVWPIELNQAWARLEPSRPSGSSPRGNIVFIGNSALADGFGLYQFKDEFKWSANYNLAKYTMADSILIDWYLALKSDIFPAQPHIDYLVVAFPVSCFPDQKIHRPNRLGHLFMNWTDLGEIVREYRPLSFGDFASLLAGKASKAFSLKQRIRVAVLQRLVPGFLDFHDLIWKPSAHSMSSAATFNTLSKILELARKNNTRVIAWFIPTMETSVPYPEVQQALDFHGVPIIDMHQPRGLASKDFADGFHLAPTGKRVTTFEFTRRMNSLFRRFRKGT